MKTVDRTIDVLKCFAAKFKRKVGLRLQGIQGRYAVTDRDYNARRYWREHHAVNGYSSLQGVGHSSLSAEMNDAWYRSGRYIFSGMVAELGLTPDAKVLEFGYGTGYYTKVVHDLGFRNYVGVDIVNAHESQLRKDIPQFQGWFQEADVGTEPVTCIDCQLIFSIDMTQHIVNSEKLKFLLTENVLPNLAPGGSFLVTDALLDKKFDFNECSRSLKFYSDALGLPMYHAPVLFRDKFMFSFRKPFGG